MIRRLLVLMGLGLFLAGCGTTAERSEFWQHDSMYRSWDHMKYSWSGYKKPDQQSLKKSQSEDWWGIPTPEGE